MNDKKIRIYGIVTLATLAGNFGFAALYIFTFPFFQRFIPDSTLKRVLYGLLYLIIGGYLFQRSIIKMNREVE